MKTIILIILFMAVNLYAETNCTTTNSQQEIVEQLEIKTDVPKFLEGATIVIRLANGQETSVPAEKFKVVPRKQQFIATLVKQKESKSCSENNKHRVSVLTGQGAQGGLRSDYSSSPSKVQVESKVGHVFGAQYQYKLDQKILGKDVSVGVQGQSNKTGSLLLGLDF